MRDLELGTLATAGGCGMEGPLRSCPLERVPGGLERGTSWIRDQYWRG